MTESVTQHYQWTKPEVTKSASTWGGFLNTDLDSIDALVFANQQGIVPVGAITMFAGATAPANWLICDGRSLDTTAYAALFAVLQYAHGGSGSNFNLPNLTAKYPLGAGSNPLGQVGGAFSVPIAVGNLPTHAHPITDVTHNHVVNVSQTPHNHPDPGHTHGVSDPGHFHDSVQQTGVGNYYAFTGQAWFGPGVTGGKLTGISIQSAGTGIQSANANVSASLNASGTGLSTTQNVGSGTPLSVTPPFVALNFIIRAA